MYNLNNHPENLNNVLRPQDIIIHVILLSISQLSLDTCWGSRSQVKVGDHFKKWSSSTHHHTNQAKSFVSKITSIHASTLWICRNYSVVISPKYCTLNADVFCYKGSMFRKSHKWHVAWSAIFAPHRLSTMLRIWCCLRSNEDFNMRNQACGLTYQRSIDWRISIWFLKDDDYSISTLLDCID